MENKISLNDCYLFSGLSANEVAQVVAMARSVSLKEGEVLFQQQQEARSFYFVESGTIKLSRFSVDGEEKVIELVMAGRTFAEALMFLDTPRYPVTATAMVECRLQSLENNRFLELLRHSPETCFRMMGDMSIRLHRLIKEIEDLSLQSATSRVAGYFCGQLKAQQSRYGEKIDFRLTIPKAVIASRLSIKPETFSRILKSLSQRGIIEVKGGWIKVTDTHELRAMAESAGVCGGNLGPV